MHPLEVRYKAVVHYTHFLHSIRRVAAIYKVSKSSLQRWIKASPFARRHRSKKQQADKITQTISQAISTNPFITCKQLAHILSSECAIKVSRVTAGRYIRNLKFSKKT
jgi:transposase